MPKYRADIDVRKAQGYQTYEVIAASKEEAYLKFVKGEGDIVEDCLEPEPLFEDITIDDIWKEE